MRFKAPSQLGALSMALLFAGCSSGQPMAYSALPPPRDGQVQDGVKISVSEFASPQKSRPVFAVTVSMLPRGYEVGNVAAEVGANGVLPLWLYVWNESGESYAVNKAAVAAIAGGERLTRLSADDAADTGAQSEYKKAYGWDAVGVTAIVASLPLIILMLPYAGGLDRHPAQAAGPGMDYSFYRTCTVGKFRARFESLELVDTIVKPGKSAEGFVYFKLPEKLTSVENLTAEITLAEDVPPGQSGKSVTFKFTLPPVQLTTHE